MAAPRTLYVSRPLTNPHALRAWARTAGFPMALAPEEMHVTVAFSRTPLDWNRLRPDPRPLHVNLTVDGPQRVKQLGAATVLRFHSALLMERWRQFREAGASWDHPDYQPHITLTYQPPNPWPTPPELMQPYHGPLIFGPERFREVNTEWAAQVRETPIGTDDGPSMLVRRAS